MIPKFAHELPCHSVYTCWHAINQSYKPYLSQLGLTYPQYITLTLLWESDKQTVTELSQALLMQTSTLTPLLKRMEKQELITRTRSLSDERVVIISLSEKGRAIQDHAEEITACMIEKTGMTHEELDLITKMLTKLRHQIKES